MLSEVGADDSGRLVLAGDIDLEAAIRLRGEALRAVETAGDIRIDWSAAGHLGAAGLQVLVALRAELESRGRRLILERDNPGVRSALELTGLSLLFPPGEGAA